MDSQYLNFNELDNALNSLTVASQFIITEDVFKWKWVAIAIHHSLYSFCICALVNGNFDYVLSRNNDDIEAYYSDGDSTHKKLSKKTYSNRPYYRIISENIDSIPSIEIKLKQKNKSEKLISFWTALARAMDDIYWMKRTVCAKPLILSDEQLEKIYWLTNFVRNDLVHFIPKLNTYDISYLKECLIVFVDSIEFLLKESHTISSYSFNPHPSTNDSFTILRKYLSD